MQCRCVRAVAFVCMAW